MYSPHAAPNPENLSISRGHFKNYPSRKHLFFDRNFPTVDAAPAGGAGNVPLPVAQRPQTLENELLGLPAENA